MPDPSHRPRIKQLFDRHELEEQRYHWEFLRRGELYVRAYRRFAKKYHDWIVVGFDPAWLAQESIKRGENPRIPSRNCFLSRASVALSDFRKVWKIDPTDPASPNSPFLNERTIWVVDSDQVFDPHSIALTIDLRGPESELIRYLQWRIREEKKRRGLGKQAKTRRRFDVYDDYLRAFDLKKTGMTDREIAKDPTLLSRAREHNVAMNEKRVLAYRNKAKRLIIKAQRGLW